MQLYPGGHGPMWDMPDNATSIALIEAFVKSDKPVGACHAPVALINVRGKDGEIWSAQARDRVHECRRRSGLERDRAFLLEDRLKERVAYSKTANWVPSKWTEAPDRQNPASSGPAAEELKLLRSV